VTTARRDLISDESVGAYVGGCAERILAGNVTDLSATVAEWVERVRADPQTWEDVRAGLAAERPLVRAALSAEFAAAIRAAATTAPGEMAAFAYDHAAALVEALRVPDCGDQYHGADGGPCSRCGFDAAGDVQDPVSGAHPPNPTNPPPNVATRPRQGP
jgi:hypothetical protein